MSGWGNESFDVATAGGWGDTSMMGGGGGATGGMGMGMGTGTGAGTGMGTGTGTGTGMGAGAGVRDTTIDKIPYPATVKDLNQLDIADERFAVGKYLFSTIHTVGRVKSYSEMDVGQSIEYVLSDLEDPGAQFQVIHYKGVSTNNGGTPGTGASSAFVEDTLVSVVGKLRSFSERLCIVAFDVREIDDIREADVFKLEAKLARLYYTKNVPERGIVDDFAHFQSTLLRGATSGGGSSGADPSGKPGIADTATGTTTAASTNPANTEDNCRGLTGQKAEIFKYLHKNGVPEIGLSVDAIRTGIPRSVFNPRTFATDLEDLSSEGLIYTTCDDDHYIVNA